MEKHSYNATFGQVIDTLEDGQIAERDDGGYVVKRNDAFYFGTDVNVTVGISPTYLTAKWRITPFFEDRLCACGCHAPLKPRTEAYAKGVLAPRHTGAYYDHKHEGKAELGLIKR